MTRTADQPRWSDTSGELAPRPTSEHEARGAIGGLAARLFGARAEEMPALLWSILAGFLLLASYNITRPIRDQMGAAWGTKNVAWLMTGTMLAMVLVSPAVSWLVSRLQRRAFLAVIFRFFVVCLGVFSVLVQIAPDHPRALGAAFFIWNGVFNLLTVSLYWGFLADVYREEQAHRLFGVIGVGGTLGGIAGAGATSLLVPHVPAWWLLVIAAVLLEASVHAVRRIDGLVSRAGWSGGDDRSRLGDAGISERGVEEESPRSVLHGLALIVRSRYLRAICLYMLLFALTSTVVYVQRLAIVREAHADAAEQTRLFARIDLWVNVLTAVAQVLLTGRVMAALGVGRTLAVSPLVTAAGLGVLAASPTLGVIVPVEVVRRGLHYAVDRPAREVLYTVLGQDEKYKSKSFIDTFIYRAGDLIGAWMAGLLPAIGVGAVVAAIPLSIAWMAIGLWLGAERRRLAAK